MRPIKFRAWNRFRKEMKFDVDSSFQRLCDNDGPLFSLMQFTGLLDKNGKEIYEGDILATSNDDPEWDLWDKDESGYTVVVWDQENDGWTGSKWVWEKTEDSTYSIGFVGIIGNIYENPELLTEKEPRT